MRTGSLFFPVVFPAPTRWYEPRGRQRAPPACEIHDIHSTSAQQPSPTAPQPPARHPWPARSPNPAVSRQGFEIPRPPEPQSRRRPPRARAPTKLAHPPIVCCLVLLLPSLDVRAELQLVVAMASGGTQIPSGCKLSRPSGWVVGVVEGVKEVRARTICK